jgi:hypothetical protein
MNQLGTPTCSAHDGLFRTLATAWPRWPYPPSYSAVGRPMQKHSIARLLAILLAAVCGYSELCGAQGRGQGQAPTSTQSNKARPLRFQLVEVATFGVDTLMRQGDLGILRSPVSIREGPDGSIYVADLATTRVVRFDARGEAAVSYGRYGRGPGEFIIANSLDLDEDGVLYVLDRMLGRMTTFDSKSRQLKGTVTLKDASELVELLIVGDTIWLLGAFRDSSGVLRMISKRGDPLGRALNLTRRDATFGDFMMVGGMARGWGDTVLYARPIPTLWAMVARGGARFYGRDVMPGKAPSEVEIGPRMFRVTGHGTAVAISRIGHDRIAIFYTEAVDDGKKSDKPAKQAQRIDVYSRNGQLEGTCTLAVGAAGRGFAEGKGGFLYLALSEPFVHVGKFKLVEYTSDSNRPPGICE